MRKPLFLFLLFPLTFIWIIGWALYWTGSRQHKKQKPSPRSDTVKENLEITVNVILDEIAAGISNKS